MAPPEDARDLGARAAKGPRIVVVPFGVSEGEFEGFGTALAALIHGFALVDGESPALARVYATRLAPPDGERSPSSRPPAAGVDADDEETETARETGTKTDASGPSSKTPKVLEAELAPWHWSKVAPPGGEQVGRVITGYLEPPLAGRGMVRVTVFDPTTERVIATAEADCDEDDCGTAIAEVLAKVLPGPERAENPENALADLRGLPWEALAAVLQAEKLLLPEAQLPESDAENSRRLSAALLYLGRAVSEAPEAPFPARRLAAVVSSVLAQARQGRPDPATVAAARRAIVRATQDAPKRPEPAEVAVVAALSEGDLVGAEARALTGLALFPQNPRFPRFLVEIRRERGDYAGAREALDAASREPRFATDLGLAFEAARLALAEGDFATARRLAAEIATAAPGDVAGPLLLADVIDGYAAVPGDPAASLQSGLAEDLEAYAEAAIASGIPVLLRRAIVLLLTRGVPGAARGALLEAIASRYILEVPGDPEGYLVVAKAGREAGDRSAVDEAVVALQKLAPGTPLEAEALVEQFGVHAEEAAATLDRIAETASNPELAPGDLEALQLQALHLAQEFSAWPAYHLAGLLAARIGLVAGSDAVGTAHWRDRALAAFDAGLALAPGALPLLGAQSRFTLQQLELEQESHAAREPASGELVTKARAAIETLTRLFAEDAGVATLRARLALATGDFEAVATHVAAARALEADVTLGKALEAYLRSAPSRQAATSEGARPFATGVARDGGPTKTGAPEAASPEAPPTLLARIKGWFS